MDRTKAGNEIMELFIKAVRQYNALEKIPAKSGSKYDLYHSERHLIDRIGDHPGVNVTEFARIVGITKGAVSQVVRKLERKGLVKRYKGSMNDKEVFLELTRTGREIYINHKKKNDETVRPLIDELQKYPDDKVEFFVAMLAWINDYLESSSRTLKA
jgi:DNA-binding MarR family transcriptional regulator